MARQYANQFDAVMAGYRAGRDAVKDWQKDKADTEAGQAFTDAQQQTESVSGPAALENFNANYVQQEGGPTAAEYVAQNPSVFADTRKPTWTMGDKTQDRKFTPQEQNIAGTRAMGAVYSGAGQHDTALRFSSAADASEANSMQREAMGMQLESAKRDETWRKETANAVTSFNKGLTNADGTTRTPTLKESFDLATQLANVNVLHGKGHIFDVTDAQTKAEQARKEGYIDALKMAHAGNKEEAIKAFNRYGDIKIKDLNLTPTVMNVGGVKVPTFAIQGTTSDGQPFNIPNAYGAMVHGMTFEQAAKAEELKNDTTRAGAAVTSAGASVVSAGAAATAAQTGVNKENRANTKEDKLATASADYQAALDSGDKKQIDKAKVGFLAAGGKLEKPVMEYGVTANPMGGYLQQDKATGRGAIYDQAGKKLAEISQPGPPPKAGEEKIIQTGENKGKTAVFDGTGWLLKK